MADRVVVRLSVSEGHFLKELEREIRVGNFQRANSIIEKSPLSSRICLRNHVIGELPVLHYLARKRVDSESRQQLENLIRFYVDSGYKVDKRCADYPARKRAALGFTALLAAIEQANAILLELLIKFGADVNVRDERGLSACHWAVFVGELKALEVLLNNGADLTPTESELTGVDNIHPILHTAIDEGRSSIVFHLVNNNLVNLNEVAVYRKLLCEAGQAHFPSRYNCVDANVKQPKTADVECTPLARAVRMKKIGILEMLLKAKAQLTGFCELHFCILEGDTEVAYLLVHRFSDEELCSDKIGSKWALHCLHPKAFQDEAAIEFTKKLIFEYVDAGWDINATSSDVMKFGDIKFLGSSETMLHWSNYTLLHLACFYKSRDIVRELLLEEGVKLSMRSQGGCSLNPLQVSILRKDWGSAKDLINSGSDLDAEGSLELQVQRPSRINREGNWDPSVKFSSVELLLGMAADSSVPLLDLMLKKGVKWHGANELLAAIEGGSLPMIARVFSRVGDFLKAEEFSNVKDITGDHSIPSLIYLLGSTYNRGEEVDVKILADLLDAFIARNYDCNKRNGYSDKGYATHLIFAILETEFKFTSENLLLKKLLSVDQLQLNVRNEAGLSPVEYIISLWNKQCISEKNHCWRTKDSENYCCETVKLLIEHGANVQDVTISKDLTHYHHGYQRMFHMLYFAGAKFAADFFTPDISCHVEFVDTAAFPQEIEALRKWTEETAKTSSLKLKWKARISTRGLLYRIGALEELEPLPSSLKAEVLCQSINC